MTSAVNLIELYEASRHDSSGELLLDSISWKIGYGESWGLTGPSGSGKTLLMRTIALLDPFEGELRWKGECVEPSRVTEYRSKVIYLAQAATLLDGTVETNLRMPFGLEIHSHKTYPETMLNSWCKRFGKHHDFMQSQSSELSGGERQIVALLRALSLEPELLLLDEATNALDPTSREIAEDLVADWMNVDPKCSVVWVTHDDTQRKRVTHRELSMESGRVMQESAT